MIVSRMLDTDVSIEVMRRRDHDLLAKVYAERHLAISMVTEFELLRGQLKSGDPEVARTMATFIATVHSRPFDSAAAAHAAEIRVDLERAGTPIGSYDVLIAGHARAVGLTLVTRNTKHFQRVAGLKVERW